MNLLSRRQAAPPRRSKRVCQPLGLRCFNYGLPPALRAEAVENVLTGRGVYFPLTLQVQRVLGISFSEAVEISNHPRFLSEIIPAGNLYATADEACRFYQLLLNGGELDGVRVFEPRTVQQALSESSYLELDRTIGLPLRYGLGFMLGAPTLSLYGPRSPNAFGHIGFIHVLTWADPGRQIAVALLTSGKPFVGLHLLKVYKVITAIAKHCPPL